MNMPLDEEAIHNHLAGRHSIGVYPLLLDETCWFLAVDLVLLTKTVERRRQLGLDSYDRLFPNQDTMPKGGFGNPIALPLQKLPRELGRSVFLDEQNVLLLRSMGLPQFRQTNDASGGRPTDFICPQQGSDLVGVFFATTDYDEAPDPWTLPPSRKRPEKPMQGPMPAFVEIAPANLLRFCVAGRPRVRQLTSDYDRLSSPFGAATQSIWSDQPPIRS
jgi:hypothetical protein